MARMMTRMTRWLDSHDSLARWLAVCQDPLPVSLKLHLADNDFGSFHPLILFIFFYIFKFFFQLLDYSNFCTSGSTEITC